MPGALVRSLVLLLLAHTALGAEPVPSAPAVPAPLVVGVVPLGEATLDADLRAGLELALVPAPNDPAPAYVLRVGAVAPRWGSAAESAVDLVRRRGALVLVGPPSRATGHLLAQVGTRLRVPVLSTSGAASVTASGSRWIARVVLADAQEDACAAQPFVAHGPEGERFVAAFRARSGRAPTRAAAAGYDAGQTLIRARARAVRPDAAALKAALLGLDAIPGADGVFALSATGQRLAPTPVPAAGSDAGS